MFSLLSGCSNGSIILWMGWYMMMNMMMVMGQGPFGAGSIYVGCGPFQYYNASYDLSTANPPPLLADAFWRVTMNLEQIQLLYEIPSISFGVVYNNDLIFYKPLGKTNLSVSNSLPNPNTIYEVGSVSKLFTTLMAFNMRDKGICRMDDPISKFNSDFSVNNPWGVTTEEKQGKTITLKQLASQISGLGRESPCVINATSTDSCSLTTAEILNNLKGMTLIHAPDTQPSYSNFAFALLGNIMAEYMNLTYEEALKEYVLMPLGLSNTGLFLTSQQMQHAAVGYNQATGQAYPFSNLGWEAPAGQIFSTVADLATVVGQMLMSVPGKYSVSLDTQGQLIFNPQTMREMLRPVFYNPDLQSAFGSPWEMQVVDGHLIRSKGGNVNGFSSSVALVPEMRLGVVALSNAEIDGSMLTLSNLQILIPAFAGWLNTQKSIMSPNYPSNIQSQLNIYEGTYRSTIYEFEASISLQTLNNAEWMVLFLQVPFIENFAMVYVTSDNTAHTQTFALVNLQDEVFSCWQTTGSAVDGGHIVFQMNSNNTQVLYFTNPDNDPFDPFHTILLSKQESQPIKTRSHRMM